MARLLSEGSTSLEATLELGITWKEERKRMKGLLDDCRELSQNRELVLSHVCIGFYKQELWM